MKVIKEHRNRFIRLRLVSYGADRHMLEIANVKRGMRTCSMGGGICGQTSEESFRIISAYMHAHPRHSVGYTLIGAAERWIRYTYERQRNIWDIADNAISKICDEAGLDREDRYENDWSEQYRAAEAEFELAAQWAELEPEADRYSWQ